MFNNITSNGGSYPKGAFEIETRVREQERALALMNAESKADLAVQRKHAVNPILALLTSFFSLVR